MILAVLSDIHGNFPALRACVDACMRHRPDAFLFLGDYLCEGPYPRETLDFLKRFSRDARCFILRGNREEYFLSARKTGARDWKKGHSQTGTLLWNYEQLTQDDFAFLEGLPSVMPLRLDGAPRMLLCHGTPLKTRTLVWADQPDTWGEMRAAEETILLGGHTHKPADFEIPMENGTPKRIFNPGTVGLPEHGCVNAECMLLHIDLAELRAEFLSVPYDREKVRRDLYDRGLFSYAPCWTACTQALLQTAEPWHMRMLQTAERIIREKGVREPSIPEEVMEEAWQKIRQDG